MISNATDRKRAEASNNKSRPAIRKETKLLMSRAKIVNSTGHRHDGVAFSSTVNLFFYKNREIAITMDFLDLYLLAIRTKARSI